jgi:hypothetical protein
MLRPASQSNPGGHGRVVSGRSQERDSRSAMGGDPRGEHIARTASDSNDRDWHGAKTLEGLSGPARVVSSGRDRIGSVGR